MEALQIVKNITDRFRYPIEEGFILHIGGNQWYKNRLGTCKIYAEFNLLSKNWEKRYPLILAGKKPDNELLEFLKCNSHLAINFIITPSNKEIQAMYSTASLLLFPSIKEGFRWPILEAMACGCPVVTTKWEPMTEVGGNAAIYIDPLDYKPLLKLRTR